MKVAILEDYVPLMEAMCESVRCLQPGAEVVGCTRWDELEPLLGLLSVDLVLMDMRLNECLGIELIPRIHELSPESRVVVVSAFMDQDLLLRSLNLKIDGYLSKLLPIEHFSLGLSAVLRGESHFDDPAVCNRSMPTTDAIKRSETVSSL